MRGFAAFIAYLLGISIVSAALIAAVADLISPVAEPGDRVPAAQARKVSPVVKATSDKALHPRQAAPRVAKSRAATPHVAADRQNATANRAPSLSHTADYWDWRRNGT
jgi:hypothetical protein